MYSKMVNDRSFQDIMRSIYRTVVSDRTFKAKVITINILDCMYISSGQV